MLYIDNYKDYSMYYTVMMLLQDIQLVYDTQTDTKTREHLLTRCLREYIIAGDDTPTSRYAQIRKSPLLRSLAYHTGLYGYARQQAQISK